MKLKIIILVLVILSLLGIIFFPQRAVAEPVEIIEVKPLTLEQHLEQIFGDNSEVAIAVLKHESGLNLKAKNWNCRYNGKSTFCKKEDRHLAWSVDCGIAQVNIRGQICPKELMTLEGNMKAVEKIYKIQGLNAWVSYKSGSYKKFL